MEGQLERKTRREDVNCIQLTQDGVYWWGLMNTTNLRVP